eukprot:3355433-Alexandrium_andersonii.AAC.1
MHRAQRLSSSFVSGSMMLNEPFVSCAVLPLLPRRAAMAMWLRGMPIPCSPSVATVAQFSPWRFPR